MTNQEMASIEEDIAEGMQYGSAGERAIIGLLRILVAEVRGEDSVEEAAPVPEPVKPSAPSYEDVVIGRGDWANVPEAEAILDAIEAWSPRYDAMPPKERAAYGSRHAYMLAKAREADTAGSAPVIPEYVYLPKSECSELQQVMAVGRDQKGNYAVAIDDLTPAQRARYVQPTSNADDFGGLPG